MLRFLLKLICYLPFKLIWWTKWSNKKELKKYRGQPVILAVNHRSGFDGPMMVIDVWRKSHFWIKAELFENKFKRWFFRGMGGIPVKTGASLSLVSASQKVLREKHALILMPEGHRSFEGGKNLPLAGGVALVALHAQVPIIPVVTDRKLKAFRLTRVKVGAALDSTAFLEEGRVTKEGMENLRVALQTQMQQLLIGFEKKPKLKAWQTAPNIIARGIVIRDEQLLVIKRQRDGEEFYVLPGGHLEPNETDQAACTREVLEETGVQARPYRDLYKYWYYDKHGRGDGWQTFFVCEYLRGEPHQTDAEEYTQPNRISGTYEPMWVPMADLKKLALRPVVLKKRLLKDYRKKGARLPFPLRRLPNKTKKTLSQVRQ